MEPLVKAVIDIEAFSFQYDVIPRKTFIEMINPS